MKNYDFNLYAEDAFRCPDEPEYEQDYDPEEVSLWELMPEEEEQD